MIIGCLLGAQKHFFNRLFHPAQQVRILLVRRVCHRLEVLKTMYKTNAAELIGTYMTATFDIRRIVGLEPDRAGQVPHLQ